MAVVDFVDHLYREALTDYGPGNSHANTVDDLKVKIGDQARESDVLVRTALNRHMKITIISRYYVNQASLHAEIAAMHELQGNTNGRENHLSLARQYKELEIS